MGFDMTVGHPELGGMGDSFRERCHNRGIVMNSRDARQGQPMPQRFSPGASLEVMLPSIHFKVTIPPSPESKNGLLNGACVCLRRSCPRGKRFSAGQP